jgi:predicted nucleotidyltransferase
MIMDKQFGMEKELIDKISNELQTFYFVGFAIVFGSVGEGRATNISDVDIGVYVKEDVPLTSLGLLSARCETVSGRKVDLVILFIKRNLFWLMKSRLRDTFFSPGTGMIMLNSRKIHFCIILTPCL